MPEMPSDVMTLLLQILGGIASVIIIPTFPLAYRLIKAWMEAKIAHIKSQEAREAAEFALKRLDHLVTNTVDEIAQTTSKNTGLSDEEKKHRKGLAITRVKSQLTDKNYDILKNEVNNIDRYILTKIEATRFFQKTLQ